MNRLPDERQAGIADYAEHHTLRETLDWLRADGVKSSSAALSNWLAGYGLSRRFERNETVVKRAIDELRRSGIKPEEAEAAGQYFFNALAMDEADANVWSITHSIEHGKAKLELDKRKVAVAERRQAMLEKKAKQAEQAEQITKSDLTSEQKAARMREVFGIA